MNPRRDQQNDQISRAAAAQRAKLVSGALQPGEYLTANPAACVYEQTRPVRSKMFGLHDEGFLFATDRRLIYRTIAATSVTWRFHDISEHSLRRCSNTRLVCALPASARLRGIGWRFATLIFTTENGRAFAVHGGRPFLAAIAEVLAHVDANTLPPMPTTTIVVTGTAPQIRCRQCRYGIEDVVEYCPSCGRRIDWNEPRPLSSSNH